MITAMSANEIKVLLAHKIACVDCKKLLIGKKRKLQCKKCGREYSQNNSGVWDFTKKKLSSKPLDIYLEASYQRWQTVFKEREVFRWSIYDTKLKRFFSQAGHRRIAKLIAHSPEDKYLLEIGAGNGALLKYHNASNYIGLDFSEASLAVLKSKHKSAIVIWTNDNFIPFGRNLFENIVSLHTMEHIYLIGEHIEEVKRLLRHKGKFHFVIPTEGGFAFWLGRQLFTGPHLRRTYKLDVNYVMDREHINDAKRVLKFLRLYFGKVSKVYWPARIGLLSVNAMIYGFCIKD